MKPVTTSLPPAPGAIGFRGWFLDLGRRSWRALEQTGQARAQRHLLDFAGHCEALQPELAKELRAAGSQAHGA